MNSSLKSNFIRRMRAIWHPDEFHGWGLTKSYFEGWYFKLVSKDEKHAYAFIPGIAHGVDGESQAFIQVMDGSHCKAEFHRFDSKLFDPSVDKFAVKIDQNHFDASSISLDLPNIKGEVKFSNTTAWPKMFGAPGIMGWYSFVPFMECFHGVVSLHHNLSGSLVINGEKIDFTGGKGYIEKDWGRSFPKAYVWMQSNHFANYDRASLVASVADIPWLAVSFVGFISGFWLDGKLYKFATYTGAKKYLTINDEVVNLIYKSAKTEIRLEAKQAKGTALVSPISGEMTGKIQESLQAKVSVQFLENGKIIFEDTGTSAGLEVAGDIPLIVDKI